MHALGAWMSILAAQSDKFQARIVQHAAAKTIMKIVRKLLMTLMTTRSQKIRYETCPHTLNSAMIPLFELNLF